MEAATRLLARDPLRNIVLLKHLQGYAGHTRLHHVADGDRNGFLVVLDAAEPARGPVARFALPAPLPPASHVTWMNSEERP